MIETLTLLHFEPCLGEIFCADAPGGKVPLRLEEAKPLGEAVRDGGAFALYFDGPPAPILPQAIYPLAHERLGELGVFIVPIQGSPTKIRYEAIFT